MARDIMSKVVEVSTFEHGTFEQRGKDTPFARVYGRDQHNRFVAGVAYGPPAAAIIAKVNQLLPEGQDPSTYGFVVELQGSITVRADKQESFVISRFNFVTGPSVELRRNRVAAVRATEAARDLLAKGDLAGAYRALEEFTAAFGQVPAPSVDHGVVLESRPAGTGLPVAGIEEEAARKLAESDARRGAVSAAHSTPVADAAAHETVPESAAPEVEEAEALDAEREASDNPSPEIRAAEDAATAEDDQEFGVEDEADAGEPEAEASAPEPAQAASPEPAPAREAGERPAPRPMVRPILGRGLRRPPPVPGRGM